jgi:hypothetical protein
MADPLQTTFDVQVGNDTYTFRIPSIKFDVQVSYRAWDVRKRCEPEGGGVLAGVDTAAYNFSRYAAYMELYLDRATVAWPFSVGAGGVPRVDFERFSSEHLDDVYAVGAAFDEAYARFRRGGDTDGRPAGAQAVAGEPDPGAP